MININPDIVCDIILKIREFQAKEEVVLPEESPSPSDDTDWAQVLAEHEDDLTYQEIQSTLDGLEPDQVWTVIALLFVGRGDFDRSEWASALDEAKNIQLDQAADFILNTPLAADYLKAGLIEFDYECDI